MLNGATPGKSNITPGITPGIRSSMRMDAVSASRSLEPTPIFAQKLVERCHIILPDTPTPTSAIYYEGHYYAYVKFFDSVDAARQKATLMTQRGNAVVLTRVPKGVVLWVLEPEAQIVRRS